MIRGGAGNNIIWADHIESTGGRRARSHTTRIFATSGNNQIYGGRGTNIIHVGSGDNFIRGGAYKNRITTGGGNNVVRLQGHGHNHVTLRGGYNYVESFVNDHRPVIRCVRGAHAFVVYGNTRPQTNCHTVASARSRLGKRLQVMATPEIVASDRVVNDPIAPGQDGIGVPRPRR